MRSMFNLKTRRRRLLSGIAALTTIAAVALAAFLTQYIFEGEGSTTTGHGATVTEKLAVTFGSGELTPGTSQQVFFEAENKTGKVITVSGLQHLEYSITDTNSPACPAEDFYISNTSKEAEELLAGTFAPKTTVTFPIGTSGIVEDYGFGTGNPFKVNLSPSAPSACETVTVSVKAKLTT